MVTAYTEGRGPIFDAAGCRTQYPACRSWTDFRCEIMRVNILVFEVRQITRMLSAKIILVSVVHERGWDSGGIVFCAPQIPYGVGLGGKVGLRGERQLT